MEKDSYKTISGRAKGIFKDKGSKFIALIFPIKDEKDVKTIVKDLKKEYHDARHHCYAYRIGIGESCYRMNDDGEPSGTAGKPIYGQIVSYGLSDVLIVVIRYFGGTLLGVSGLINAYRNAAYDGINNSVIVVKTIKKVLKIRFKYELMNKVMRIIKEQELDIKKQDFMEDCQLELGVRTSKYETVCGIFRKTYGVEMLN